MGFDELMTLSGGWPVLLCMGLMLGCITVWSVDQRAHLLWFLPMMLLAAISFVFFSAEAASVLILAPERLGIGVIALLPAVTIAFAASWALLSLRAKTWLLVAVPAMVCLVSTPLAGYVARVAVCDLVGDCP
jgi:hypothetical protein